MIISTTSNLVALTSVDHIHLFLGSEFLEVYIDLSSSSNVKKVIAKSTFCYAISQMIHSGNLAWLGQIKAGLICDMQSLLIPAKYQGNEGFRRSHPVLLVVAGDETNKLSLDQKRCHLGGCGRDGSMEFQSGFQSAVLMVRCSHQIVALGLEIQVSAAARNLMAYYYSPLWQIHCIDIHLLLRTVFSPIPFLSLEDKEQVFVKEIDSWIHNSAATQTYDWALLISSKTCASVITISGLLISSPRDLLLFIPLWWQCQLSNSCFSWQRSMPVSHCISTTAVYFILNQQSSSPRHPFTLYVDVHSGVNSLEHLLVYTPSGYVIKLELLPSIEAELNESDPATWSGSYVHSERKRNIFQRLLLMLKKLERTKFLEINLTVKLPERSHLYLSNAEVQISSGRLPIMAKIQVIDFLEEYTDLRSSSSSNGEKGVMVEGFLVLHNWRLRQGHQRNLSVLQTLHSLPPLKAQMKRSRLLQGILELSQISPFEGKVVLTCTGYPW
ncbi:unnamed protein product [Ilex paraguariensis]|uniref:BCAS3 domain-containing protein n=1 Tax=Ilex paraguariensis TaxID=185542 RepID=A0ABC8S158_9AQUA